MEVSTKLEGNPLIQDTKKGKLRDYHGPLYWNYGMLPQTWEDPSHHHDQASVSSFGGDGDPLDAVEISSGEPCKMGECVFTPPCRFVTVCVSRDLCIRLRCGRAVAQ